MEKVVLNESMAAKMEFFVSDCLYIIILYRVNLNKLVQIITKLPWSNRDNNN